MSVRIALLAAASAMLAAAAPASASFTVNFAGAVGGSTPGSITSGDNTLTFSSPSDPAAFTVDNFAGTGLLQNLAFAADSFASFATELDIAFAKPITGLALNFAIANGFSASDALTLTTSAGTVATLTGFAPGGGFLYAEGAGGIAGPAFTSIKIVDLAGNSFAVGNLTNAPEPMTLAVLGAGLAGLAAVRRRA